MTFKIIALLIAVQAFIQAFRTLFMDAEFSKASVGLLWIIFALSSIQQALDKNNIQTFITKRFNKSKKKKN